MNKICLVLPLLFITVSLFPVKAVSQITVLDKNIDNYSLGTGLLIFEDKDGAARPENVLAGKYDSRFVKSETDAPNYGFTPSVFWVKFEIQNPYKNSRAMLLEIGYPLLDDVEFYTPLDEGGYETRGAGYNYKFKDRELQYRNIVFKIDLKSGSNLYYIKIHSTGTMTFPLILQTPEYLIEVSNKDYLVLGLYYGILFVMVLYNLFVYLSVRDKSYLYYIAYISSFMVFSLSLNGIAYQNFWPDNVWWQKISIPFLIFVGIFTIGQFVRSFLDLKSNSKKTDKIMQLMMLLAFSGMIVSFACVYSVSIRMAAVTVIIAVIICFSVGILSVMRGIRSARFYLLAWTCFLIGCVVFALKATGYIPFNIFTQYSMQAGSALEVVLLSFALADRINSLKEEKEEANLRTIEIQKTATEELERKVSERTLELNKANEDLKELDKMKSNFFANISHEIRTPLTLILSPVESVIQGDYGDQVDKGFFENVQRNGIRLLKLINNLLDFSKLEAGQMEMKIHEIDIVVFIRNYIGYIHSAAESKGITLTFVPLCSDVRLFADVEKIDKIIMNLFSNSLKFTDQGGFIKVTIRDDEQHFYVEFEDSGIGIPSDKLESVFDRFSQVDAGSTRKYEGTGIGLSLVREFVELHGGVISVKSRYIEDSPSDHGTAFIVTIPKGKKHFENKENVKFIESVELEESVTDHRFFGMREMSELKRARENEDTESLEHNRPDTNILVVEDNPDMQGFLKFLLRKYYNVHIAVNGAEGLRIAGELKPDLIVSDVMMPVMNGYEMTQKIKEDKKLSRIPVIMLTAKSEISSKIEGIEYGADDYLTKPFNSKELLTRIRMLLKTRNYENILEKRYSEIEEELKIARLLQQKLLPHNIPSINGFSFHPTYIPMEEVGGDFYDFKANENTIEIFIADVSGHGLASAFISMITKMALDSINIKLSSDLVLLRLNEILCRSTVNYNYVTSFFCIVNRNTNVMRYSNAGHLPPLVYRKNTDEFIELNAKGKPLGWFEDLKLTEAQVILQPGDRVILYTDGITECADPEDQLYGEDRFKQFIQENSAMEPAMFSSKLIEELKLYCCNDKFGDDLCLLVFDVH